MGWCAGVSFFALAVALSIYSGRGAWPPFCWMWVISGAGSFPCPAARGVARVGEVIDYAVRTSPPARRGFPPLAALCRRVRASGLLSWLSLRGAAAQEASSESVGQTKGCPRLGPAPSASSRGSGHKIVTVESLLGHYTKSGWVRMVFAGQPVPPTAPAQPLEGGCLA